ncbi:MAG: hypothetical protein P1P73_11125, partial [Brevefilum sp.]|nr:hypothetical protein [Brevefilum sp.]
MVQIDTDAPTMGLIEMGECVVGDGSDLCNTVAVTTISNDTNLTNNTDSEPKDIGIPTAVELISFEAIGQSGSILLTWATEMETDNLGFNLYRAPSLHAPRTIINDELIPGTPGGMGAEYSYTDEVNSRNLFFYWIESVDIYGNAELHEDYASARALKKIK